MCKIIISAKIKMWRMRRKRTDTIIDKAVDSTSFIMRGASKKSMRSPP